MRMRIRYESGILRIPAEVLTSLDSASAEDLGVLLLIASLPDGEDADEKTLSARLGCSVGKVRRAIAFWNGVGVLCPSDGDMEGGQAAAADTGRSRGTAETVTSPGAGTSSAGEGDAPEASAARQAKKHPPLPKEELPDFSTGELAAILERRKDLAMLLEECQTAWGKVFNTHEATLLVGLIDYLGFDGEYILLLLSHCAKMNIRSLHSVERLAYRLHEQEVLTVSALQDCLCRMEAAKSAEGRIRSMFGLGSRSLTEKEKQQIDLWINTYRYPDEVIRRAYEITVNVKSKPSITYAGGILRRWHEAGYTCVEDIERAENDRRSEEANGFSMSTSDGDSFWEAAVRASYGQDYERLGLGKQNGDKS